MPCATHKRIPWKGSDRHDRLPPNWGFLTRKVLRRDDYICHVCHGRGANEVDHVEPGDDHSLANLAAIHHACHLKKSSAEGHAARRAKAAPDKER